MNKIFTALFISLIPLASAHAGLVQVENRVSCYLALDGNEGLMKSSGSDIAFTKVGCITSWPATTLTRSPSLKTPVRWRMNCPVLISRPLSQISVSLITATPPTAKAMNSLLSAGAMDN